MPGDKCSVLGCGSCRRTKGIGIRNPKEYSTPLKSAGFHNQSPPLTMVKLVVSCNTGFVINDYIGFGNVRDRSGRIIRRAPS